MFIVTVSVIHCWLCYSTSTSQHAVFYTLHYPTSIYSVT